MNVWMKICRKQSRCNWCPAVIEKTNFMVVTSYYRGRWLIRRNYHCDCWIAQGKDALSKRIVEEKRGKQRMDITDEARSARFKIMARRASVVQRIKRVTGQENNIKDMIHLGAMLHTLKDEIELYGG
ncbi:hypothetical protein LCGC14_3023740, partial [marine sediment metagenome]